MSRRRSVWCLAVLLLALGWPWLLLYLRDPTAQAVPAGLEKPIVLLKGIDAKTPLRTALKVVEETSEVPIVIDDRAFRELGLENVEERPVAVPKAVGVRALTVLRLILSQADASYEMRNGRVVVVPGGEVKLTMQPRGVVRRARMRQKLAQVITLDKGVDVNTPLQDLLEFLSDRHDLTILVDSGAFARRKVAEVGSAPVQLPPMISRPFASVLHQVLDQVGATFEPHEDCLMVVPKPDPAREAPR